MKYLSSFRTTLRVSRYLLRTLAIVLWLASVLLTTLYLLDKLHQRESDVRYEFNQGFEQVQGVITRATQTIRDIHYIAENRLSHQREVNSNNVDRPFLAKTAERSLPPIIPLQSNRECRNLSENFQQALLTTGGFINYWKENFVAAYDINRVFFIDMDSHCLADFTMRARMAEKNSAFRALHQRIQAYQDSDPQEKYEALFWVVSNIPRDSGVLYVVSPLYLANDMVAMVGTEQNFRLEEFVTQTQQPIGIALFKDDGELLLSYTENGGQAPQLTDVPCEENYFGYNSSYDMLLMKKTISPSGLTILYSLPTKVLLEKFTTVIINSLLFNLAMSLLLFFLVWLFERKMFYPAENTALRLDEHDHFNRRIVASAPVGISIIRLCDGSNILSNELAHSYINLFTIDDRARLTEVICEQQSGSVVDVITSHNRNLQISFVHSRYRNEEVAICVMVDVSARVKMEQSLQEMANVAEQASQSKSMFLATVSHELRTPLYGIIGNLDLLQTKSLPEETKRLLTAMSNSSDLLLKIINDILDFSKIESEQLKIEHGDFIAREVLPHIIGNYLPLVVRKRLTLYCFIEPEVPYSIQGDTLRIQQVISNLLSNAIKFTDTGCIVLQARVVDFYLEFRIHDTGMGIPRHDLVQLFDPFFQVGNGVQRHFHGTGLGLAICEKLVSLMDGDIAVESEFGMGSIFYVRLPMYQATPVENQLLTELPPIWLVIHNTRLEEYLRKILSQAGIDIRLFEQYSAANGHGIIISDQRMIAPRWAQATIVLLSDYVGHAQSDDGIHWTLSTAAPLEVLTVLQHIQSSETAIIAETTVKAQNWRADGVDTKILLVDDHPINRRLLADQLVLLGYADVTTANDGLDALSTLARESVDIILTDVNMPNMDGYQLTEYLREQGWQGPIIGVTANALAEERERCIQIGMDTCLSKPITLEDLGKTLGDYVQLINKI